MNTSDTFIPASSNFEAGLLLLVLLVLGIVGTFGYAYWNEKRKPNGKTSNAFLAMAWAAVVGGLLVLTVNGLGSAVQVETAKDENIASVTSWVAERYNLDISAEAASALIEGETVYVDGKSVALVQSESEGMVLVDTHDGWSSLRDTVKTEAEKQGK